MVRTLTALLMFAAVAAPQDLAARVKAVREAHAAGAADRLNELAAAPDPDPWLVVDELLFLGATEPAKVFAALAKGHGVKRLPAYVSAAKPRTAGTRPDFNRIGNLLADGKHDEAASVLEVVAGPFQGLDGVRHAAACADVALGKREPARAIALYLEASESALALGWGRRAFALCRSAFMAAYRSGSSGILRVAHKALAAAREFGDPNAIAGTHQTVGALELRHGTPAEALRHGQEAARLFEQLGNRLGVARSFNPVGQAYGRMGQHDKALESYRKIAEIVSSLLSSTSSPVSRVALNQELAWANNNMGVTYQEKGAFAEALAAYRKAHELHTKAGYEPGIATTLANMGRMYNKLYQHERALDCYARALPMYQKLGKRRDAAGLQHSRGLALGRLGRHEEAAACLADAVAYYRAASDLNRNLTQSLVEWGTAIWKMGRKKEGEARVREGLSRARKVNDLHQVGVCLGKLVYFYDRSKRWADVIRVCDEMEEVARRAGSDVHLAVSFASRTFALAGLERNTECLESAEQAMRVIPRTTRNLPDALAADAATDWDHFYLNATLVAVRIGDINRAYRYLEWGKAPALRAALGGRDVLRSRIPKKLREAENAALRSEAAAVREYQTVVRTGARQRARLAWERVETARAALSDLQESIQLQVRLSAELLYQSPPSLAAVQARLQPGDAMVCYHFDTDGMAFVITRTGARHVFLGGSDAIDQSCADLLGQSMRSSARANGDVTPREGHRLSSRRGAPAASLDVLRSRVVDPLQLSDDITRVFVVPHSSLTRVPLNLLFSKREVVHIPSGSTLVLLADDRSKRGRGVLAVGNPTYPKDAGLDPIPATQAEAKTVGTSTLLGEEATVAGVREMLGARTRWRALHLACHGAIDPANPALSGLALTPVGEDDGKLRVTDIQRMRVHADLVALSACETAVGKLTRSEGTLGLTRAFMLAGASRVLVSQWRVDDDATSALMKRFYELWNPKEGGGLAAAAALRKAQAFVRGHDKWKHPYYWGAWQLWGLE